MTKTKTKKYELVAKTDGYVYSMKLPREKTWRHAVHKKAPEYVPFPKYQPLHLKNLRRAMKLMIGIHWPGFIREPD